jgi:hypothetical protein
VTRKKLKNRIQLKESPNKSSSSNGMPPAYFIQPFINSHLSNQRRCFLIPYVTGAPGRTGGIYVRPRIATALEFKEPALSAIQELRARQANGKPFQTGSRAGPVLNGRPKPPLYQSSFLAKGLMIVKASDRIFIAWGIFALFSRITS